MHSTIDREEVEKFRKSSRGWWEESGDFSMLHKMNPYRVEYILHCVHENYGTDSLDNLEIIDIGCGGGLVCEALAKRGGIVSGIDADEQAIKIARRHAEESDLEIDYKTTGCEELLRNSSKKFDVVIALEILEHVADVEAFVKSCVDLCKDGGVIIFSTINRTAKSFLLGIVAAEYVLGWIPRGTHDWNRFLKPSEVAGYVEKYGAKPVDITGIVYNPVSKEFRLSKKHVDVNYFMSCCL